MRNKNQKGFTLIELLVVIAIIGLLASVVLLALNSARAKSRDAKRLADVRQLSTAMELYYNDNGGYPSATAVMVPGYVQTWPSSPTPAHGTCPVSGNGSNVYTYASGGTATGNYYSSYTLTFCLGGTTGGYSSGTHTASPSGIQ